MWYRHALAKCMRKSYDYSFGKGLIGEYWIDQNGNAEYADGDYGEDNHAMIAHRQIVRDIPWDLGGGEDDWHNPKNWEEAKQGMYAHMESGAYHQPWDNYAAKLKAQRGENWADYVDPMDYVRHSMIATAPPEIHQNIHQQVNRWEKGLDNPVEYATHHLGWMRVQGKFVEVHGLNESNVHNLARGLEDAFGQDYGDDYNDDAEDDPMNGLRFTIEDTTNNHVESDIPWSEIADGSVVQRFQRLSVFEKPVPMPTRIPKNNPYGHFRD